MGANLYELQAPLPFAAKGTGITAKFDERTKVLTVKLPLNVQRITTADLEKSPYLTEPLSKGPGGSLPNPAARIAAATPPAPPPSIPAVRAPSAVEPKYSMEKIDNQSLNADIPKSLCYFVSFDKVVGNINYDLLLVECCDQ